MIELILGAADFKRASSRPPPRFDIGEGASIECQHNKECLFAVLSR